MGVVMDQNTGVRIGDANAREHKGCEVGGQSGKHMPGYEHDKQANKQLTALNPCRKRGERQGKQGHAPGVHGDQKPGKSLGFAKILGDFRQQPNGQNLCGDKYEGSQSQRKNRHPEASAFRGFNRSHDLILITRNSNTSVSHTPAFGGVQAGLFAAARLAGGGTPGSVGSNQDGPNSRLPHIKIVFCSPWYRGEPFRTGKAAGAWIFGPLPLV